MMKKVFCILLTLILLIPLAGCWSYKGLNEMAIVAGAAIDIDDASGEYKLAFEMIDLASSSKQSGIVPTIIESTGISVFDAIRNAKKKLSNKLYFGNAQIIVISETVARENGISAVTDLLLRDSETRETINIIISKDKTAKELLTVSPTDAKVISYQMKSVIDEDQAVTASIPKIDLYHIYNVLKGKGESLVLPAFKAVKNNEKMAVEASGTAIFKKDKLIGFLSPEEARYYLFVTDKVHGGLIPFKSLDNKTKNLTLEISDAKTKFSFSNSDNQLKLKISPTIRVSIGEIQGEIKFSDEEEVKRIKKEAEDILAKSISDFIIKIQKEYRSDIFGFGKMIYKKDFKLWTQLEADWENIFPTIQVEVTPTINIINTALIKEP